MRQIILNVLCYPVRLSCRVSIYDIDLIIKNESPTYLPVPLCQWAHGDNHWGYR